MRTSLLTCTYNPSDSEKKEYSFFGNVKIYENELLFENLTMYENDIPYEPKGVLWNGTKITALDALTDVIGRYSRNAVSSFAISFLHDTIKKFVDNMRGEVVCCFEEKEIFNSILFGPWLEKKNLILATDKFLYYSEHEDGILMFNMDGECVSDNCFATVGFESSLSNIATGNEKELWCIPGLL